MNKNKKKDLFIKICCVIAAFMLWLYIANIENPIKSTVIKNVPVTLLNKDSLVQFNLVELPKQNYYVNITVRGQVNQIYSLKASQFKVTADMSAYALKNGENRIPVEINSYPNNVTVVNSELWAKVQLDDLIEKNVPVKVKMIGSPKEGFALSEPVITPSNVLISGPAEYVNSVSYANIDINLNNSFTNIEDTFHVKSVDNFGRKIDYVKIDPSYVKLKIVLENAKKVPIKVNLTAKSNDNFTIKSITVNPKKIEISGDSILLNKVKELYTEEINFSDVKHNQTIEIPIKVPNGIKIVNGNIKVKAKIQLEQVIEKNLSLKVNVNNLNENYEASLKKDTVNVKIVGGKNSIQNIKDSDIKCYVDLNELNEGTYNLPILVNTPDFVTNISYEPKAIEVTINKKEQEDDTTKGQ